MQLSLMSTPFSLHRVSASDVWAEVGVLNRVARRLTARANWLYLTWELWGAAIEISLKEWHRALGKIHRNLSFVDGEYADAEEELGVRRGL